MHSELLTGVCECSVRLCTINLPKVYMYLCESIFTLVSQ